VSWYDALKDAAKLAQQSDNVELMRVLLDAQNEAMKQQDEIQELKERVRELEDQLEFEGALHFRENAYWSTDQEGQEDGPFCSRCWDKDGVAVRLHAHKSGALICPECTKMAKKAKARTVRMQRG
jgi:hypothetical protein